MMGRPNVSTSRCRLRPFTHVCVVAANVGRLLDGLHTLAVHDGGTRVRVTAHPLALGAMQSRIQQVPCAAQAEAPEMVVHRLPRWEVGWQITPGTARAQHV